MDTIYLDSNVWDLLHANAIDLLQEFPPDKFKLALVREGEFEIPAMPEALRAFVDREIARCSIGVLLPFGFYDDRYPPDQQRVGGFDQGSWLGPEAHAFRASQVRRVGPKIQQKTGLLKNEADSAFAAESFNGIVLTFNKKRGPLKTALAEGGMVIFLNDFQASKESLGNWVALEVARRTASSSLLP